MVYTVTFNPAIDYVMHLEKDPDAGMTNRSAAEEIYYGGKGINVSVVLHNLGVDTVALGFIAGFTGAEIQRRLGETGIKTDFISLPGGHSRINIKLKGERETEINAQGPKIDDASIKKLFSKFDALKDGDMLVLAGSIPNSLPKDIYERIMERLKDKNIAIVVDATGDLLVNVLKYHPFLIKPNHHELGEIFGKTLTTDQQILDYAKALQEKGAQNVLVSMASAGALLLTEDGTHYKIDAPPGEVKNSVGAGDSMVAGFIAGFLERGDYQVALRMGAAAGSATAFSEGLAERETVKKIFEQM